MEKSDLTVIDGSKNEEQIAQLSQLASAQDLQIKKMKAELVEKSEKIKHLEEMLIKYVPDLSQGITHVSDEEMIARLQMELLKKKAMDTELSLEEIKKYDLLVKNKRLAAGESTVNAKAVKLPTNEGDLLKLASQKTLVEKSGEDDEF